MDYLVSVEDVIPVQNDVSPRDRADMAEKVQINVIRWCMHLDDAVNFLGLPIDDTSNHKGETATRMPLL